MEDLKTGDLVLFQGHYMFSRFVQCCTQSKYSHCGIILKDPTFTFDPMEGIYLWECGGGEFKDVEDNTLKLGVQIISMQEVLDKYDGDIYVRQLMCPEDKRPDEKRLEKIYNTIKNIDYNTSIVDWAESLFRKNFAASKNSTMICSSFASYVYTKCGVLSKLDDWSICRPSDLAEDKVRFNEHYYFDDIAVLKKK